MLLLRILLVSLPFLNTFQFSFKSYRQPERTEWVSASRGRRAKRPSVSVVSVWLASQRRAREHQARRGSTVLFPSFYSSQAMKTRVAIFCPRRTIFFKIAMKGTWRRPEATHSQKYLQVPQRVASDKEYVLSSVLDQ